MNFPDNSNERAAESEANNPHAVVIISAGAEWNPVRSRFPYVEPRPTPYGQCLTTQVYGSDRSWLVTFFHGGWGKIDAAASAQYAIDRWRPSLLVNLGTCGGFAGDITAGEVLLVNFTLVHDIVEQMSDPDEALAHYATEIDLGWLRGPLPLPVRRELLLSADHDIIPGEIAGLRERYGAIAADWESGAIAHVAGRNNTRCLILRAVSDLVGPEEGEAYVRPELFNVRTEAIMNRLLDSLPSWLALAS
jgi:adenosylhomocysteine nucleosidase